MDIEPDEPALEDPVDNEILPLPPDAAPPSPVDKVTSPLDEVLLPPLWIDTCPPVDDELSPLDSMRSPPTPDAPLPTLITIVPLSPFLDSPVFIDIEPDEPAPAVPV